MIRYVLIISFAVCFLVLSIPLLIAEWIIGKFNPGLKDRSSRAIILWVFRCIMRMAGTKVIVLGQENIPTDTAVVYVGNHRSVFDVIMTYLYSPRLTGFISKIEFKKVPLFNLWMNNIHCLFLDRKDIKQGMKTTLAAIEKAKNGISICIFPEGTRNRVPDTILPFHEGSFKIAEKSGAPVVPMSIVNAADIFEDHFPKVKKTTVVFEFCKPIYMNELDKDTRKSMGTYCTNIISEAYFKNKKEYFS